METKYRIVFKGVLVEGFDPATVKRAAAQRLKLEGDAIERVFCGRRAVLKKNLDRVTAERYLGALRQIGMQAGVEEQPPLAASPAPEVKQAAFDALSTVTNPLVLVPEGIAPPAPEPVVEFDPHKTHINLARAEELLSRVAVSTVEEVPQREAVREPVNDSNDNLSAASTPVVVGDVRTAFVSAPALALAVPELAKNPAVAEPPIALAAPSTAAVGVSAFQVCSEPCCPRCGEDLSVLLELYMQDALSSARRTHESSSRAERGWLYNVWGWLRPRAA
ncbi:hypothetical protein [Uliginosibacterium gangwonense]|uniref:hypothetical protein n=1 Tax=Uliginosibacterium gangwonense TaxID=392736 RepID=UPI00036748AB|nr:hypothetical protein [Uliginosibacterium gangwonense]